MNPGHSKSNKVTISLSTAQEGKYKEQLKRGKKTELQLIKNLGYCIKLYEKIINMLKILKNGRKTMKNTLDGNTKRRKKR